MPPPPSVYKFNLAFMAAANADTNLSLILVGAGGGTLTTGRFVKHGGKPASNLFLTMADRMGIKGLERFGDSTGRLIECESD